MDQFGITPALVAMVEIYSQAARRTGRTTRLIDGLADGDVVICVNLRQAKILERAARDRGKRITCRVFEPTPGVLGEIYAFRRGLRIRLDHVWIEMFYRNMLLEMGRSLAELERIEAKPADRWEAVFCRREQQEAE